MTERSLAIRWTVRWLVGCAACLVSLSTVAVAGDYRLPTIGQPADQYMSPAQEDKLGRQVVAQLLNQGLIIEDTQLSAYLNGVGRRLARHTPRDPGRFNFYVIDEGAINAFALPGGYIGVNSGLILETDNESELGGVMAHEIAHVTQRHIARQVEASAGAGWQAVATLLVAAIAGAADPDAAAATISGGLSHLGQQQINYTRAHEYEADRVGIRTLAESGYDPDAMASFFKKLQRRSRLYGNQLPQILLTHPVSNTRMAEAQARAQNYPHPDVHESDDYALMKERARVLTSNQYSDLAQEYVQRRRNGDSPALRYGYALTLTRLSRTAEAIDLLEPLADAQPERSEYILALANAHAQAGALDAAQSLLSKARKRFPGQAAPKLAYARTLIQADDTDALRNYLLGHPDLLARSPDAQQMLARAAGEQGHLGEAYYRQARYYQMRGAYPQAISQLRTAFSTADLNAFDKARLHAQFDQIVQACEQAYSKRECRERVEADERARTGRTGQGQ